jgi:carboxymethylenebutenolidase
MIDIDGTAAYRAEPVGEIKGGLIVIHEVWGLVDHIKSIADRFAAEGYLVVAPDILSSIGLVPEVGKEIFDLLSSSDEATRSAAQPRLREAMAPVRSPEFAVGAVKALRSVVDYLEAQPGIDGRIGVTGFCFGGTFSFALAANDDRVRAAIPFYGTAPAAEAIAGISCPVLAFYGGTDTALMDALPGVTEAMASAGVDFTATVFEQAGHAFFNDTNSVMYNADAATRSWPLALEFLERHVA